MKIIGFTMLSFFAVVNHSHAQQQVHVGIKAGLDAADITNFDGSNRISGQFGVFLNAKLARGWRIQPELLYSGEGQRYWDGNDHYTLALNYVQIPVMFQYYPVHGFYVEFGPQLGILASARDKGPDGYNHGVTGDYNKTEARLNLGMGVQATPQFGAYVRYGIGLSDITPDDNYTYNNRVFQLGITARLQ